MSVKITGTIDAIFTTEVIGNFQKRVFWLTDQDPKYPQTLQVEMHQADCSVLDGFAAGDTVDCHINLRGRMFERKDGSGKGVINTLRCWKLEKVSKQQAPAQQQQHSNAPVNQQQVADMTGPVPQDDLPF